MNRFEFRTILSAVMALTFLHMNSNAASLEQQALNTCVDAAKEHDEIFRLDEKVMKSRCECVKDKRGRLPSTKSGWKNAGKDSATLTMVECAQSDIISFYSGVILKSEMSLLQKRGGAHQDREIQKIENFSACVGEGSYNEIRRVAALNADEPGVLDKSKFRKMYSLCKAAVN